MKTRSPPATDLLAWQGDREPRTVDHCRAFHKPTLFDQHAELSVRPREKKRQGFRERHSRNPQALATSVRVR